MFPWLKFLGFAGLSGLLLGAVPSCSHSSSTLPVYSAWSWFSDPRAIRVDNWLIVGSVDTGGYSRVDTIDLTSDRVVDSTRLNEDPEVDDHNNPALLQMQDGRMLAAYARHSRDLFWCSRVGDLNSATGEIVWSEEQRNHVGASVTYSNLFQLEDEGRRIYNFFRGLNFNPTFSFSDDGGASWSEPRLLMQIGEGRTRPYLKYCSDGQQRIDFFYTEAHPRDFSTSIYHLYYEAGQLHRSGGTPVGDLISASPISPKDGTRIFDGSWHRAWVWDIERYPNGNLAGVIVVSHDDEVGKDLRYYHALWDGTKWDVQFIAYAGSHLYEPENHYAGGIALDTFDPYRVYLSTNSEPLDVTQRLNRYQLYSGQYEPEEGKWSFKRMSNNSAGEETGDRIRPYVCFEYLLWLQGSYTSYTEFQTRLRWVNTTAASRLKDTR